MDFAYIYLSSVDGEKEHEYRPIITGIRTIAVNFLCHGGWPERSNPALRFRTIVNMLNCNMGQVLQCHI